MSFAACGTRIVDGPGCLPACGATQHCDAGTCVDDANHCTNGVKDGGETAVDCGGPDCAACAPTCSDGIQNGNETGVDCGGNCPACGPTCSDHIQNGGETGVDCGGNCPACPATCSDLVMNGSETDVDCGGSTCGQCADGKCCLVAGDCLSSVCAVDTSGTCATACAVPTCSDGAKNGTEKGVDCGGSCAAGCPDGTPCDLATECTSGVCNITCQVASCFDGVRNQGESDQDCGGPCAPCADTLHCFIPDDCQSGVCTGGVCQAPQCGDGVKNGSDQCDGTDFGTATCATYGKSSGSLACTVSCTIDSSGCSGTCGNGIVEGSEQCDLTSLNGATCASLGYAAGTGLACSLTCTFDTSGCGALTGCPATCPDPTMTCSASTGYACTCPIYETACGTPGVCTSLLTDPQNCGACGTVCPAGSACSSGKCMSTCQPPLQKCDRECVDILTDNVHCGGCPGTDCTAGGTSTNVCSDGICVTPVTTLITPAKCVGGGPPINVNPPGSTPVPPSQSCSDDLALVSFRWALCSCKDVNLNQNLFTDGFDSSKGPYDPTCEGTPVASGGTACTQSSQWTSPQCTTDTDGDKIFTCVGQSGAGIGANGLYSNNQTTMDWGTLWWASPLKAAIGTASVQGDINTGGDLPSGTEYGRAKAHVAGNVLGTGGIDALGTHDPTKELHIPSGHTVSGTFTYGSRVDDSTPVGEPCDCQPQNLVNVKGIINAHKCTGIGTGYAQCQGDTALNDNYAAHLDPDVFKATGGRIDLPCGNYYFSSIQGSSDTTIVAHGNTAVYVGGNVGSSTGSANINFELDPSATLDIFILGGVCNNATFLAGSANYPARTRMYIAGGTLPSPIGGSGMTCSGTAARAMDLHTMKAAANFYAPWGKLYTPQSVLIYGSLFTGNYDISQQTTIHFDTAITSPQNQCDPGGGGGPTPPACTSCRDCMSNTDSTLRACDTSNGTCGMCNTDADCCAPLRCVFGGCITN